VGEVDVGAGGGCAGAARPVPSRIGGAGEVGAREGAAEDVAEVEDLF
jgi:hypothetical protein